MNCRADAILPCSSPNAAAEFIVAFSKFCYNRMTAHQQGRFNFRSRCRHLLLSQPKLMLFVNRDKSQIMGGVLQRGPGGPPKILVGWATMHLAHQQLAIWGIWPVCSLVKLV